MSNETIKTAVPLLRFPEFREASGWVEKPLNQICQVNPTVAELPETFVYIDLESVENGVLLQKKIVSKKDSPSRAQRLLQNGDVIFQTVRPYQRNNYFFQSSDDNDYVASTGYAQLRAHQSHGYLFQYVHTNDFVEKVLAKCTGSSYPAINSNDLSQIQVVIPSLEEQQKIAACLSSLDDLLTAQTAKLAALQAHKRGLLQGLFPTAGETVPKLRFPEFREAGEWEERTLGEVAKKVGSGITPSGGDKNYKAQGLPFVRSQNIGWGILLLDDVAFIDEKTHATFPATEIIERDILLNITGASIGRCAVADSRIAGGNVNQHVCIIRTTEALNPFFLSQHLIADGGQNQINSFQAGGNRQGLNFVQIRSFQIPMPSTPAEQQKIAACLSFLDDRITAQTAQLAALQLHKKGLMQALFPTTPETTA